MTYLQRLGLLIFLTGQFTLISAPEERKWIPFVLVLLGGFLFLFQRDRGKSDEEKLIERISTAVANEIQARKEEHDRKVEVLQENERRKQSLRRMEARRNYHVHP